MFSGQNSRFSGDGYQGKGHRPNKRFMISFGTLIPDEDIRFQVEKIPPGLNFIDLLNFKNMTTAGINGNIIKVFTLKEYVVYMYTATQVRQFDKVLLLEKLEFLKGIISDRIESELWIIKDSVYLCVGMFNGVPVFTKHFNSVNEINDNVQMMTESMNRYSPIQNIRFFCCDSSGFYRSNMNLNIFEYSEQFMSEIMSGCVSLNDYCRDLQRQKLIRNQKNAWGIGLACGLLITTGCLYYSARIMNQRTKSLIERISMLKNQGNFPTQEHYQQIKEFEQILAHEENSITT